jgi:transmembrane sensor
MEEQAARWFVRRDSAKWTDTDQVQFAAWLAERSAHRIEFLRLEAAWNHAGRLKALGARVPSGDIPPRRSWGDTRFSRGSSSAGQSGPGTRDGFLHERRRWVSARFLAVAAAACVLVVTVGAYVYTAGLVRSGDRYVTPVGGIDNVRLADGSQITLNTDTSIRVILTARERRVQLERGEAFFEVAKDKSRPFVVYAGRKRVMAVGTKFAVRRDDSEIQVVVTEGRVRLAEAQSFPGTVGDSLNRVPWVGEPMSTKATSAASGAAAPTRIPPPTYLNAGDIARTSKSEVLVHSEVTSEAELLLSWRKQYVVFNNTSLADAVAEFNRYNTRKIYIEDPEIATIRIGGNFKSANTAGFLGLLQSGFPITVEQRDDGVVLRAR